MFCLGLEMRPQWYALDSLPFQHMWPDDELWFPHLLADQPFYGYFLFQGMDTILNYRLTTVDDLDQITIPQQPLITV